MNTSDRDGDPGVSYVMDQVRTRARALGVRVDALGVPRDYLLRELLIERESLVHAAGEAQAQLMTDKISDLDERIRARVEEKKEERLFLDQALEAVRDVPDAEREDALLSWAIDSVQESPAELNEILRAKSDITDVLNKLRPDHSSP